MPSYRALKGIRTPLANVSVAVVLADGGAVVPATVAALALGSIDGNRKLLALGKLNIGDDVELGQVDGLVAGQQRIHFGGNDRLDADLLALGEGAGGAGILQGPWSRRCGARVKPRARPQTRWPRRP